MEGHLMKRTYLLPILGLLVSLGCAGGQSGRGIEPDESDIIVHAVNQVGQQVAVYAISLICNAVTCST
jgi:hypothetical protein